ncbi:MAG: hypothetical protein CGU28_04970 [Candidatus Dactylopiibacterium carminicum]|uniref:Outer membrane protein assembly factor BamE n=1 Tax=Candidatus Dactylopiibacterium carminicum TaxID=857335 RepID=A0A272EU77_9RHOO|nr:outer membrane protein assembly factor BamE [Candidatus Dactylopiibacterium carminicum]KAF7599678.1 outer membrane protein assembly factor BamE [Candidatus Dactylopiibacterium carminicum]PAS93596.1 MAG: hypothetical protein CGU29_07225 [Candidatus Dactylopiibacterium carminicum]PAS97463.1 MAG: hypothetical protein CGU28_04970 [Candidatus Dactylopiibacterium carminicum]PAS99678.1 MAG: hypothetical protein BSR46_06635 [Candidatus Dactylopiibacterium carminicum]
MRLATLALALGGIAGCSSQAVTSVIRPFRIDVRQGNYVSQHSIDQLQPGMTQDQVRFVMGSPMLVDIFHADRWDYVYQFSPGRGQEEHRRTSVFFVAGKLDRVEAGALPKEPDPASLPRVIDIDSPQG